MSTLKEIQNKLKKEKPYLKKQFHVKKLGIFGSYARNEQSIKSDIDMLVEFSVPIGWEFFDLKSYLEKKSGKKIDLVTVKALKPQLKKIILKEVKYL